MVIRDRPAFDRDLCRTRNVVERCFHRLKQFCAIATRFDEFAACPTSTCHVDSSSGQGAVT
ncbi:hypothetical protein ABZ755_27915 [Streptomyces griseoincarnatus]